MLLLGFSMFFWYFCSKEFAGEQIPMLHEAVDLCERLDLLLFLELKSDKENVSHNLHSYT